MSNLMKHRSRPAVARAAQSVFERLEDRRLLAFTGSNYALPIAYDFNFEKNGVADADGENTGFPIVQGNDLGDELQADLIDLDRDAGLLRLTTRGDSSNGSNFQDDNTLANVLQVPVNLASGEWLVSTRVARDQLPLTQYDTAFEQAGLIVGPSQDNYIKLVFGHDGTGPNVQFLAEVDQDTFPLTSSGAKSYVSGVQGVNLSSANYVDLWISGNPTTGVIQAQYRVQGGQTVRFSETVSGGVAQRFFSSAGRAGLMAIQKNDGDALTASFASFDVSNEGLPPTVPTVRQVRPADEADDVNRDAFVAVDIELPNTGLDASTVTTDNLRLVRVSDNQPVDVTVNTTGGTDAIVLTPRRILNAQTEYRFEIDSTVMDDFGNPVEAFSSTFTTGFGVGSTDTGVAFDQVALPAANGDIWTGLEIGPDGKLYATELFGEIHRWTINSDGTLSGEQTITSLVDAEGGDRVTTGLVFDPDSTASNLIVYVTHTDSNDVTSSNPSDLGQDFTGKVTRFSGANLENVQDVVTGLPRSTRDHLTNQPNFGPDGFLYLPQGANTAMGETDAAWGFRPERLLTSSILRIDLDAIGDGTVNVKTADGGTYNPFADDAPVTLYATGVRNAYDLVWHSNGSLYAPTNGSAAGGNTPASPQPTDPEFGDDRVDLDINGPFTGDFVPGLNSVSETQNDYLYKVEQGGYYGSPNPTRDEWVLNGGNPTAGDDGDIEVVDYPVGTQPDRNYRGFAFDFGLNQSPDGAIEYQSDVFDGFLQNSLIVTRWSGGDDLLVIELDDNGDVIRSIEGISGFSNLDSPLDVIEGPGGTLYVSEFDDQTITLLRPVPVGGEARVDNRRVYFNAAAGESSDPRPMTIRNTGTENLVLDTFALGVTGADANLFEIVDAPTTVVSVAPGDTYDIMVQFNAPAGAAVNSQYEAIAFVRTSDDNAPELTSKLFAFTTAGGFDANEPSLQYILDRYGFDIDTGDDDPSDNDIVPGGDVLSPSEFGGLFQPADANKPVAFEILASFGPDTDPAASFGWYEPGTPSNRQLLSDIIGVQQIDPIVDGPDKFTPDDAGNTFGLWVQTPTFLDDGKSRIVYSEDQFNTWEPVVSERRKVVAYPAIHSDGGLIPDAYVVTFEEFENASDYNDIVVVFTNVQPVAPTGGRLAALNQALVPASDRVILSNIDPANRDNRFGTQQVRNSQQVTVRNVGSAPLEITGSSTSGPFAVGGLSTPTLPVGAETTFTVNFTASALGSNDGLYEGSVTIETDANDLVIDTAGFWMPYSEDDVVSGTPKPNAEPTLAQLVTLFGFDVNVGPDSELNNGGNRNAAGDEFLSDYWRASGPDVPVEVYQLAAFHNTNTSDTISWFEQGNSGSATQILQHNQNWAQSIMPGFASGSPAQATFEPGEATFGLKVQGEFSDDDLNTGPGGGHHFRFYPFHDNNGLPVADTWLVAMDFFGFNYDYNDNVYLVKGMVPAGTDTPFDLPASPVGASFAQLSSDKVGIFWKRPEGLDGVAVLKSVGGRDNFKVVNSNYQRDYLEAVLEGDSEIWYRIQGIRLNGGVIERGGYVDVRVA